MVRCTRRGFFQITGVAAGGYLLGTGDGERRAVPRWLQVAVDAETVVPEAVAVERLVQLPVELSPPTHPGGLPWRVAVRGEEHGVLRRSVTVPPAPPGGVAEVEILLPALEIEGVVVDAHGAGVPGARVAVMAPGATSEERTQDWLVAGDEGRFAVPVATAEETLVVWAVKERERSSQVAVTAKQYEGKPVRLVLRRQLEIHGWVVTPSGAAGNVELRVVPWTPDPAAGLRTVSTRSDARDRFAVEAPADTVKAAILAWLPGFGLVGAGWRGADEGDVVLAPTLEPGTLRLPRSAAPWELRGEGFRVPGFFLMDWAQPAGDEWLELTVAPGRYACCSFPYPLAWGPQRSPTAPCTHGAVPPGGDVTLLPPAPGDWCGYGPTSPGSPTSSPVRPGVLSSPPSRSCPGRSRKSKSTSRRASRRLLTLPGQMRG